MEGDIPKPRSLRSFSRKITSSLSSSGSLSISGGSIRVKENYPRKLLLPRIVEPNPNYLVIIPTASTLDSHLETLLACGTICERALILGSVISRLKSLGYSRTLMKIKSIVNRESNLRWFGFSDENYIQITLPRNTKSSLLYFAQMKGVYFVTLSENDEFREQIKRDIPDMNIMKCIEFIEQICRPFLDEDEYKKLYAVAESAEFAARFKIEKILYTDTFDKLSKVSVPLPNGLRKRGILRCINSKVAVVGEDAIILSSGARNHAIHGDFVEIEPLEIKSEEEQSLSKTDIDLSLSPTSFSKFNAYRVVSIIKPSDHRRNLVVTLDVKDAETLETGNSKILLCVPMDERYPKIRIQSNLGHILVHKRFVVQILDWPESSMWPNGKYLRTIGNCYDLSTESSAILVETELDDHERSFPFSALSELPDKFMTMILTGEEEDYRNRNVVSIDPIGCQDIDDAISLFELPNGNLELGVHIADVARFVKSGGSLDKEASSRATSVYLKERRLDMLPAILCEDLCSLRPKLDRYALSAIFIVDKNSYDIDVKSAQFKRTLIHSRYALTYQQAQNLIDGRDPSEYQRGGWTGGKVDQNDWDWLRKSIRALVEIARVREKERKLKGAVALESENQYDFSLDSTKKPVEVLESHHLEIHNTVAELMILANEAAARLMLQKMPSRALLRYHPSAVPSRFKACIDYAKSVGINFDASSNKAIAASLDLIRKQSDPSVSKWIENLATRAMSEAQYVCAGSREHSDPNFSPFYHFGLGLDFYTHFTSPIRRYADLVVARLILEKELPLNSQPIPKPTIKLNDSDEELESPSKTNVLKLFEDETEETDLDWAKALGGDDNDDPFQKLGNGECSLLDNWFDKENKGTSKGDHQSDCMNSSKIENKSIQEQPVDEGHFEMYTHTHSSTSSVQSICDHINSRHRCAKEASLKSQELFFSLYFANQSKISKAIVYSIKSDGLLCYLPAYDLRIPIKLYDEKTKALNSRYVLYSDQTHLEHCIVVITPPNELVINLRNGKKFVYTVMQQIEVKVFCNLEYSSLPAPRIPRVECSLILGDIKLEDNFQGKISVVENVLHLRDQKKQVIKKPVENSSSFYHSLEQTKISLKSNVVLPSNLSKRSINELKLRGCKLNFESLETDLVGL